MVASASGDFQPGRQKKAARPIAFMEIFMVGKTTWVLFFPLKNNL